MQPSAKRRATVGLDDPLSNGSYAAQTLRSSINWKALFIVSQARPDIFSGIFSANRAGRDWVLITAPHARLTLKPPTDTQPQAPFHAQLAAVKNALSVRGQTSNSLTILAEEKTVFESICSTLASPNITALTVQSGYSHPDFYKVTSFLQQAATAFPAVSSLTLIGCWGGLIEIDSPWSLTHLSMTYRGFPSLEHAQANALYLSLSLHLPKLKSIEVSVQASTSCAPYLWPALLHPQSRSRTLTSFTTKEPLTDLLCGLLLSEAPALKRLCVGDIGLTTDVYGGVGWGVETLHCATDWCSVDRVHRLPRPKEGRTRVEWKEKEYKWDGQVVRVELKNEQGMDPALARRLCDFEFACDVFIVYPSETLPIARHPTALTHVLTQLQHLCAPQAKVPWQGWHWTHTLTQTLATGLANLPHLRFDNLAIMHECVDDKWLGPLIQLGRYGVNPAIESIKGPKFELDQYVGDQWTWEELTVRCFKMASLLHMPHPSTAKDGGRASVYVRVLDLDGVALADIAPLQDRLAHIDFTFSDTDHLFLVVSSNDPATATAQLSLLHAINWAGTYHPYRLSLDLHIPLTQTVMAALQTIPQYKHGLAVDFRKCTLPLPADAYTQLATHVPLWVKTWRFDVTRRSKVLKCILDGVESYRESKGLKERLRVSLEEFKEDMCERKVGKHVMLVYW